jgi:hypothetical protein
MNVNTQISRGVERLLCQREGERIGGMHGLSGMGCVDTFNGLAGLLDESGFVGVADHVGKLRRTHRAMCARLKAALPVAVDAARSVAGLGGLKKDIKKALKSTNVAKIQKALTAEQKKLDKAPTSKKAPARAAYVAQLQAQLATAAAAAPVVTPNMTPGQAGAAVLEQQSGVALQTPAAQDFAQQLVSSGGGGSAPSPMYDQPPAGAAADGTIFGMQPLVAAGVGVGVLGAVYLFTRRGKR